MESITLSSCLSINPAPHCSLFAVAVDSHGKAMAPLGRKNNSAALFGFLKTFPIYLHTSWSLKGIFKYQKNLYSNLSTAFVHHHSQYL